MPRAYVRDSEDCGCLHAVVVCPECGKKFRSPAFDESKLDELKTRHVQDVFPDWSPADRELYFMPTGLCGECWDKVMAPPDEGDDDGQE